MRGCLRTFGTVLHKMEITVKIERSHIRQTTYTGNTTLHTSKNIGLVNGGNIWFDTVDLSSMEFKKDYIIE